MISSKTGPDIMQVAENVNVYASKKQLVPIDDLLSEAGLDLEETFGPVGANYTWEDATYGVPDRSGAMVMYYDKDLFDEAGIEYPTAEWDSGYLPRGRQGAHRSFEGAVWLRRRGLVAAVVLPGGPERRARPEP